MRETDERKGFNLKKDNMALKATAAILTARGDLLNEYDGFIAELSVGKKISYQPAVEGAKDVPARTQRSAVTSIAVGGCELRVDDKTGFVGMFMGLQYTELLCSSTATAIKQCMTKWFKTPTSQAISETLLKRDRGASQFLRNERDSVDVFVHPAQILSNVDVGASTRTWLVSASAFSFSYHQISRAFEECPRDFLRIDDHIEALQSRVDILSNKDASRQLMMNALAATKAPYPNFDYISIAQDSVSRLCLLARADLAVMNYLKEHGDKSDRERKCKDTTVCAATEDQLRFLRQIAKSNGDLWFERSAHLYDFAQQNGVLIVFPSGYIYSVIGSPGVSPQQLMKHRIALARFESILPYIPYELSGYSGDIDQLATIEVQIRKGATAKVHAKVDVERAKASIAAYALRLANSMILDAAMLTWAARTQVETTATEEPLPEHSEGGSVTD